MLSLQLEAGGNIMDALHHQSASTPNTATQKCLKNVMQKLEEGALLSEALAPHIKPYPLIFPLLKLGESTGSLTTSLNKIIQHLEDHQTQRQEFLIAHIQPLFLALIGLSLIGVVLSLFAPLYEVLGNMRL